MIPAHDYGPNCNLVEADLDPEVLQEVMALHYTKITEEEETAELQQNTPEWLEARRSRLTCSNLKKVASRRMSPSMHRKWNSGMVSFYVGTPSLPRYP